MRFEAAIMLALFLGVLGLNIYNGRQADETSDDEVVHHPSGDPSILADHHLVVFTFGFLKAFAEFGAIGIGELDYVYWCEVLSRFTADGATDAGYGFDERHPVLHCEGEHKGSDQSEDGVELGKGGVDKGVGLDVVSLGDAHDTVGADLALADG